MDSRLSRTAATAGAYLHSRMKTFLWFGQALWKLITCTYTFVARHVAAFWIELAYFLFLSFLGSVLMLAIKPRDPTAKFGYVDVLYMSTSALTVSGLNSIDTERFSQGQAVVLTLWMLFGGEIFVSLLSLVLRTYNSSADQYDPDESAVGCSNRIADIEIELGNADDHEAPPPPPEGGVRVIRGTSEMSLVSSIIRAASEMSMMTESSALDFRRSVLKYLAYVVLGYILVFHVFGIVLVLVYFSVVASAKQVLKDKGLTRFLFVFSTVISSFANGGLIFTNENMGVFKKNSGLLLLLAPLVLAGNTLYPAFLRLTLWALERVTRRKESGALMKSPGEFGYQHLFPALETRLMAATSVGLLALQILLFCAMNWRSAVLDGLNSWQKLVGVTFEAVNARHSGEQNIDFSVAAPAVVMLFIVAMYIPAYSSFMPMGYGERIPEKNGKREKRCERMRKNANLSQVSYVVIFVIIACIIERKNMSNDPLNFSILSMVFEIVSAYGNVGLSMGYSCGRLLSSDGTCKDTSYSFSGRWSDSGKLLIVFLMLFGRVKKYHLGGGKAWKLR